MVKIGRLFLTFDVDWLVQDYLWRILQLGAINFIYMRQYSCRRLQSMLSGMSSYEYGHHPKLITNLDGKRCSVINYFKWLTWSSYIFFVLLIFYANIKLLFLVAYMCFYLERYILNLRFMTKLCCRIRFQEAWLFRNFRHFSVVSKMFHIYIFHSICKYIFLV